MRVATISQNLQNPFKYKNSAGDFEYALLLVPILVGGSFEELHEDGVVQEVSTDHKALHLLANVDGHVALRNWSVAFLELGLRPAGFGGGI